MVLDGAPLPSRRCAASRLCHAHERHGGGRGSAAAGAPAPPGPAARRGLADRAARRGAGPRVAGRPPAAASAFHARGLRLSRRPWAVETEAPNLTPRLFACARAALRETWEETGVLIAAPRTGPASVPPHLPIEKAYAERGLAAAFDRLAYVGRAITPSRVFRRFNTRFFLCDASLVVGEPRSNDEFEDVAWHPIGRRPLDPFRDVSQFMLARAIAMREGRADPDAPLFCTVGQSRCIRVCREALLSA